MGKCISCGVATEYFTMAECAKCYNKKDNIYSFNNKGRLLVRGSINNHYNNKGHKLIKNKNGENKWS